MTRSLPNLVKSSAVPYLGCVVVAVLVGRYMAYLVRGDVALKGQPMVVVVESGLFVVALGVWWLYDGRPTQSRLLRVFLAGMIVAWVFHLTFMIVHDDNFNHLVWLYAPFTLMLLLKTPTWEEAWTSLVVFAWVMAIILIGSWTLEVVHVVDPLPLSAAVTRFQQREYWLPLDGFMGVNGRWTGPFGHNTRAGLAGAMVFIIAMARWTRSTIPLAVISGFILLITSVRASLLAVVAGMGVVVVFSRRGLLSRLPVWSRWSLLAGVVVAASVGFTLTGAGLTGRQNIWPAFWRLVPQSPWIGIGGSGISSGEPIVTISGDAHNLFLDELVRNGILGFIVLFGVLGLGFGASLVAASRGFVAPAAVLTVYLVASLTDVVNDWIQLSYAVVLILIGVTSAGAWLEDREKVESGSPP